jgi:hypothetical protein
MHGRCGTGKVIYFIYLYIERKTDIMPQNLKIRIIQQMRDICPAPSIKIVHAQDFVPLMQKSFAKV